MVEKYKNVSFIRKELLVVGEQAQKPEEQPQQTPQTPPQQQQQEAPTGPSQIASRTRSKTGKLPNSNSKYPNMV